MNTSVMQNIKKEKRNIFVCCQMFRNIICENGTLVLPNLIVGTYSNDDDDNYFPFNYN